MQNTSYLLKMENVVANCSYRNKAPISITMDKGEQWMVYGPNASGKSLFIDLLRGAIPLIQGRVSYDFSPATSTRVCDNVQYITFHDQYGYNADSTFYQQRWNQGLLDDEAPTVRDMLYANEQKDERMLSLLYEHLNISNLLDKKLIMLSSGEFRRFQIAKNLTHQPQLLIIDNPFIGLDEENRADVAAFLNRLIRDFPIQVILVVSRMVRDASAFTHLIEVKDGQVTKIPLHPGDDLSRYEQELLTRPQEIVVFPKGNGTARAGEEVLAAHNITIQYGERIILKDLNWTIRRGERWALEGQNGCGKSTLLSLICADNPQGYACDITLFGKRRGTGESIWDIKKHIGYMSPEMYRAYRKFMPVRNIVASGLYDATGLYKHLSEEDFQKIDFWLNLFGIGALKDRNYMQLSNGEQRLVLLARAFVKDPDLLILDEPYHGLDAANRLKARSVIEAYCKRPEKTLIMVSHYPEDFPDCITNHLKLEKH